MKVNTEKLLKGLNEKWSGISCPYCQNSKWTVDTTIVTPIEVNENKGMLFGGRFQPLISVSCRNCGNTVFVNGLILGCIDEINDEIKDGKEGVIKNGETK